jgi:glycerate dehydrogenase
MHRIVYLERASIIADVRRPNFPHHWVEYAQTLQPQVEERLAGATIVIVNKLQIGAELIAALPALQMIAVAATGTNNVDLAACRARGVLVSNIRGYAIHTLPEHVFALLLALSRNILAYRESVAAGAWQRSGQFCCFDHPIRDLHGAVLAIIGSGSLGEAVAKLAEAFGMRVLRSERKGLSSVRPGYTPFAQALHDADAISLHCPLTEETNNPIFLS